ncbi:MAG: ribonuclease P protein component [Isosphaeraceae bacterium]
MSAEPELSAAKLIEPASTGEATNPELPPKTRFKLPKSSRMPVGGPYDRVFAVRQIVSDSIISVNAVANGLPQLRLGLGVSKRMFRRAVDRNRAKRLIREAFRLECPGFAYDTGLDVVIRPKQKDLSLAILRESIRRLVPRAIAKFAKNVGQQPRP